MTEQNKLKPDNLEDLDKKCERLNKMFGLDIDISFIKDCVGIANDIERRCKGDNQ